MKLPIFDAAALGRGETVAALHDACADTGFFYLTHHGVPDDIISAARAEMRKLFALPLPERMAIALRDSPCNRGYEPMQAQRLEPGTPPDLKEGFFVGNECGPDHPHVLAGYFNQGPNQWPATLPSFRPAMEAYLAAVTRVATRLMRAMALSLSLPPETFAAFCDEPMSVLRLLHYPPQPANPLPDEKGCGAHTDWGCLTLLWQDEAGGLQVRVGDAWSDAPPIAGTFVVNIGDMIAHWTNERYRSTLHRVVNMSGRDRYSMPLFFEGNPGHPVTCLPGCANDAAPLYPPTTVSAHLRAMYQATYVA